MIKKDMMDMMMSIDSLLHRKLQVRTLSLQFVIFLHEPKVTFYELHYGVG